jgi:hypothetical protein
VQNPALTAAIAQLRFQLNTKGVTFTVAANHLNAAVSQTPDYQMARQIKLTTTSNRDGGGVATNETTPSNQAGNAFGGKVSAKKTRPGE